jgi:hypothetical protein
MYLIFAKSTESIPSSVSYAIVIFGMAALVVAHRIYGAEAD